MPYPLDRMYLIHYSCGIPWEEVVYHLKKDNLASGVYERIKKGILSLEFPPEFILQERNLAEELGVSRTPVREAVHRLSQEGWLRVNARRNIQVRPVSVSDLREVFQARRILERDALELLLSTGLAREAGRKMAAMAAVMNDSRGSLFSFITADQSFHSVLFLVLGNSVLRKFWNAVSEEMIWLGMQAMNEKRYDDVLEEHGKILGAVEEGKKRAAREALLDHLEKTEDILLRKIDDVSSSYGRGS
ncbi:putative D-xylose utilization operon transcriptional repressor [bioreactor metagenome]|uniref:Putative D-xylose utilization operon transcriptional repressor n=1 Tax=bioreactor metagenome TaxID=1076179 RepID=A0A644VKT1_9ZZZZ